MSTVGVRCVKNLILLVFHVGDEPSQAERSIKKLCFELPTKI